LIRDACGYHSWNGDPIEVNVVEVSPSGNRVKLRFGSGAALWKLATAYKVEEVL